MCNPRCSRRRLHSEFAESGNSLRSYQIADTVLDTILRTCSCIPGSSSRMCTLMSGRCLREQINTCSTCNRTHRPPIADLNFEPDPLVLPPLP